MTAHPQVLRLAAIDRTRALLEALEGQESLHAILPLYLDSKRSLARTFRDLSEQTYSDPAPLALVKTQIETAMLELFPDIPARIRVVRGFGKVHELLFAYLSTREGEIVDADELRVLTGDAVHTERRARELRDLGIDLQSRSDAGRSAYLLRSCIPDAAIGAANLIRLNVLRDAELGQAEKIRMVESIG